jgi:hypothetical protein
METVVITGELPAILTTISLEKRRQKRRNNPQKGIANDCYSHLNV